VKKKAREAGLVALAPVAVPAAGALVLGLGAAVVGVAAAVATVAGPVLVIRSKLTKAKRRGRAW
jgi:Na+(H+)/acetate symporter ActP